MPRTRTFANREREMGTGRSKRSSWARWFNGTPRPDSRPSTAKAHRPGGGLLLERLEERLLPSVSVLTNKADYAPGEVALITGDGFQAGEAVKLQVTRTDGQPDYPSGNLAWQV